MKKTKEKNSDFDLIKNTSLVIIDGNNVAFRMYFAHKTLSATIDGKPVNSGMIYGFTKFVINFIQTYNPLHVIVTWDSKSKYRYEIYPKYKAGRNRDYKDAVKPQFGDMSKLLSALGIKQYKAKGYEADDIVYTLVTIKKTSTGRSRSGAPTVVVSTDKDLLQLVREDVVVFRPGKNDLITVDNVGDVFGVPKRSIFDYLVLCGDSADNIKGVPGIGEKTAQKILHRYGTIDEALDESQRVDIIPGLSKKITDKLRNSQKEIELARNLIKLIYVDRKHLAIKDEWPSRDKAEAILKKYEIKTIDLDDYFDSM